MLVQPCNLLPGFSSVQAVTTENEHRKDFCLLFNDESNIDEDEANEFGIKLGIINLKMWLLHNDHQGSRVTSLLQIDSKIAIASWPKSVW